MRNLDRPLSARQLIVILIIAGLIVALVLNSIRASHAQDRDVQVVNCLIAAPAGWNCELHPTGYPSP